MEFERTLYRLYDRAMNSQNFFQITKILSISCLTLTLLTFSSLLFFHASLLNSSENFSKAISHQLLNDSSLYRSEFLNLTLVQNDLTINLHNTTLLPEDIYNISIGAVSYQYSQYSYILFLPLEMKQRLNITEHNLTLDYEDIVPRYLWPLVIIFNELDTVVINQLGATFSPYPGTLKNLGSGEVWAWKENDFRELSDPGFLQRIFSFFLSLFNFCILSLVTGLVCRLSIAGSAGIMISLSWCMTLLRASENTHMILFYAFPWVGQPAFTLRNSGKSIFPLVSSSFLMLLVFYIMYTCTYLLWTPLILGDTYPFELIDKVYSVFNILEFYSLIFVRTKKSVLWFPRIIALVLCSFFIYRRNNFYPFMNTYFSGVVYLCCAVMALNAALIEKPILTNEGPTFESPRLVYQPIFNRNNTALPEVWTAFYAVAGRGAFTEQQMSSIYPRQGPV